MTYDKGIFFSVTLGTLFLERPNVLIRRILVLQIDFVMIPGNAKGHQ